MTRKTIYSERSNTMRRIVAIGVLGDPETMNFYPQPYSELQVKTIIRRNIENYERHGYGPIRFFSAPFRSIFKPTQALFHCVLSV